MVLPVCVTRCVRGHVHTLQLWAFLLCFLEGWACRQGVGRMNGPAMGRQWGRRHHIRLPQGTASLMHCQDGNKPICLFWNFLEFCRQHLSATSLSKRRKGVPIRLPFLAHWQVNKTRPFQVLNKSWFLSRVSCRGERWRCPLLQRCINANTTPK